MRSYFLMFFLCPLSFLGLHAVDYAYVPNGDEGTVSVIDTSTNLVTTTISNADFNQPNGVTVTPNGKFVYVSNNGNATVSVIDASTNTVAGSPITVQEGPSEMTATPNGDFVYVANYYGNSISKINTTTKEVTNIPIGGTNPAGVASTTNSDFVYTTLSTDPGTVVKVSTSTDSIYDRKIRLDFAIIGFIFMQ
ncbi:MAG: YncE family protein, partial [Parachlamydiaceae bacterium]